MSTNRSRIRRSRPPRIDFRYVDVDTIQPYERNPRDNERAVPAIMRSIQEFGFLVPIVLSRDNVLAAGHTRLLAAQRLGMREVPAVYAEDLTEDQIKAFRVIDNKTAELATWDFDLLSGEITALAGSGLVLTDFGWTQEELDCLQDVVSEDCLSADSLSDLQSADRRIRDQRRAPNTARFVLCELVFFVKQSDYRRWAESLRAEFDYDENAVVAEVKRRLGITEYETETAN